LDQKVHRERSGKQSSSSWYQSERLITVHGVIVCWATKSLMIDCSWRAELQQIGIYFHQAARWFACNCWQGKASRVDRRLDLQELIF
jgi:hypothetical protein